jgi:hypothetical protein
LGWIWLQPTFLSSLFFQPLFVFSLSSVSLSIYFIYVLPHYTSGTMTSVEEKPPKTADEQSASQEDGEGGKKKRNYRKDKRKY